MAPLSATWRPGKAGYLGRALSLTVCLTALLPAARGQSVPGGEGIFYTRQPAFRIPFSTDLSDRRIRQVLLHASEDFGKTYQNVSSVAPTARTFEFQARAEGWYWFTVQTEDQDGRRYPPDLATAQPGLKVCVDTRPPVVTMRSLASREYPLAVEWDVRDDNSGPDLQTLRAAYRPAGVASAAWIDLPVQQLASGQHGWTPTTNAAQYEVRLQVRDKAGNIGEQVTTIAPAGGRAVANPAPGAGPAADAARNGVVMVNKRRIQFNFKIEDVGPSKVKAVEVWWTQERGIWQKYAEDAGPEPPYVVDVAAEGRYGFTLVAVSGVGHAESRPRAGDAPQIWVEVDTTPPSVRLIGVEVGTGIDKGLLTIRWTATDKHLAAQPISISYGTADGQWVPVVTSIANDGRYAWRMPEGLPYQFSIKVEAVDQAGNVGSDKTPKDVVVDLSVPKARVIGVEGVKGVP